MSQLLRFSGSARAILRSTPGCIVIQVNWGPSHSVDVDTAALEKLIVSAYTDMKARLKPKPTGLP